MGPTRVLVTLPLAALASTALAADFSSTVKAERPEPDPTAPVRRVSGGDLERATRSTLLESLALEVPGLYASARGPLNGVGPGASGGLRLRGLGASPNTQIVVFEDGVPDAMGLFGHPLPDAYLPRFLDRVDVIPGGDSVLYGNGAMAGVVDVRTRDPERDRHDLRLAVEGGSFETVAVQPGAIGNAGWFDYLVAGRWLHSEGHREFAGGDTGSFTIKLRARLRRNASITLRQRTLLLDAFDPGTVSRPFYRHDVHAQRFNQSLTLDGKWGIAQGRVIAYGNVGYHQLYDGFRSRDELIGLWAEGRLTPRVGPVSVDITAGVDARVTGGAARNIVSGVDYGLFREPTSDPYQQLQVRIGRWVTLVGGLRQHIGPAGLIVVGKAGGRVDLPRGFWLAARWAQGFREPTIVERYLPFPVANPDLRPERSATIEGTAGWRWRRFDLAVTAYGMQATDYIRTLGAFPAPRRENVADVRWWGIEAAARASIWGPLSVRANYGYTAVQQYTAQTPAHTLAATLEAAHNGAYVAVVASWVGELYQNDFRQDRIADPWFLDARAEYTIARARTRLWLTVRNLTNNRYAYVLDYQMPGINVLAGAEVFPLAR